MSTARSSNLLFCTVPLNTDPQRPCPSQLEVRLNAHTSDVVQRSLRPEGGPARSLVELARGLPSPLHQEPVASAFGDALLELDAIFRQSFPENIFLDLDYLAGTLGMLPEPARAERLSLVRALCSEFAAPPLQFRYAHDFVYGFDWCRWVAREPAERANIGPFDPPFLSYLAQRARELKALIAEGDHKYHPIQTDTFRNPFSFVREPHEEIAIHQALTKKGHIPVEAWRCGGHVRWDLPFAALREETARELGLRTRDGGS